MDQVVSNGIAAFALLVSIVTYFSLRSQIRGERDKSAREIELIRIQIDKEHRTQKQEMKCDLHANMFKSGKSWRIRLGNGGPSAAHDVNILLTDKNALVTQHEVDTKFPMETMHKGQSVEINAFVHLQSQLKEDIVIVWRNADGSTDEKRITLTL